MTFLDRLAETEYALFNDADTVINDQRLGFRSAGIMWEFSFNAPY